MEYLYLGAAQNGPPCSTPFALVCPPGCPYLPKYSLPSPQCSAGSPPRGPVKRPNSIQALLALVRQLPATQIRPVCSFISPAEPFCIVPSLGLRQSPVLHFHLKLPATFLFPSSFLLTAFLLFSIAILVSTPGPSLTAILCPTGNTSVSPCSPFWAFDSARQALCVVPHSLTRDRDNTTSGKGSPYHSFRPFAFCCI